MFFSFDKLNLIPNTLQNKMSYIILSFFRVTMVGDAVGRRDLHQQSVLQQHCRDLELKTVAIWQSVMACYELLLAVKTS